MAKRAVRTHIVVPAELVESVDALVGRRKRSQFFAEAVAEKIARARRIALAHKVVGSLRDVDIPGWETRESTSEWVRASRQMDEERLGRIERDE